MNVFQATDYNDLQLLYSILKEKYPKKEIKIVYDESTLKYTVHVTNNPFKSDPIVQVDLNVSVIYGDTDSVFLRFKYNRENFDQNRKDTFKLAKICGDKLTDNVFNRPPIVLEFEKVFQPFVLLTKKRYIAKKFENVKDPFELKGIDAKGIALTRRDYCTLVKKCYKTIIDTIMESHNQKDSLKKSIDIFKSYIHDIEKYNMALSDLVITAQIAKEYSCKICKKKTEWIIKCHHCKKLNPQKETSCSKCKLAFPCLHSFSLAHINLAQKMLSRNDEIQIGDRLSYAFVENDNKKAQKFDLAEDPKYITENNLQFNRVCYLEQLAKPILALYKIVLKDSPDILEDLISYVNRKLVLFGGKALRASDFKLDD